MHELSLAQNLLRQLHDLAAQNGANRILKVKVEIGPLAGVVKDSFEFGFSCLAGESALTKDARLIITIPATDYLCLVCDHLLKDCRKQPSICPACQADTLLANGGREIILMQVEMDKI